MSLAHFLVGLFLFGLFLVCFLLLSPGRLCLYILDMRLFSDMKFASMFSQSSLPFHSLNRIFHKAKENFVLILIQSNLSVFPFCASYFFSPRSKNSQPSPGL